MKAVIITDRSGVPLVTVIKDNILDRDLISAFVSALSIFGEENLGRINEIMVNGLDIDMFIIYKYGLILIAVMCSYMKKKDIRKEAEMSLDAFYHQFKEKLNQFNGNDKTFSDFEKAIENQIELYYKKIDNTSIFVKIKEFLKKNE